MVIAVGTAPSCRSPRVSSTLLAKAARTAHRGSGCARKVITEPPAVSFQPAYSLVSLDTVSCHHPVRVGIEAGLSPGVPVQDSVWEQGKAGSRACLSSTVALGQKVLAAVALYFGLAV